MKEQLITAEDYKVVDVHYRRGPLNGEVREEGLLEHLGIASRAGAFFISEFVEIARYGPVKFDESRAEYYRVYWDKRPL